MARKGIPAEALLHLRRRLATLPPRSAERRQVMQEMAALYGVAEVTLYRMLREHARPRSLQHADYGIPRVIPKQQMERYCEVIAAIKLCTSNKQGHYLSTDEAIRLLEAYGIRTPDGHLQAPHGQLKRPTVNRYLKQWGYDRKTLLRPLPAVRFQAQQSNECWHFDLSPSDLKQIKSPQWMSEGQGRPILMIYSVVEDRSGVAYQEYHGVYGEDVEAALRFLFAAMSPKSEADFPFQGIPQMLYMDNGPIARSQVFQQVMRYLGVEVRTHLPQSQTGRKAAARAKGKVERPFRTVKEMHETLYHFHEPASEQEANAWLMRYLLRYNTMQHRSESHSRLEDWLRHPSMEEIGARATVLTLDGIQGQQHEYITWLLEQCVTSEAEAILAPEAIELLADSLATPLQVEQYLTLALEAAYRAGQKPVTPEIIASVLAKGFDDVEPTLARHGYGPKALAEVLQVRPAEIRAFLRGRLPSGRAQELQSELRAAGLPL